MQDDFRDRFNAADKECWRCNTAEHIQAVLSPTAITYASTYAHVSVHKPEFECTSCSTRIAVHPISRLFPIHCTPGHSLVCSTAAGSHRSTGIGTGTGTGRWLTCTASVQRYSWNIMLHDWPPCPTTHHSMWMRKQHKWAGYTHTKVAGTLLPMSSSFCDTFTGLCHRHKALRVDQLHLHVHAHIR